MKPLASTIRTVEWDELPARAREIPFGFNPFADGVLMAHQVECLKYGVSILAIPKGRRTGITFAWGLNSTLIAGAQKAAGGDNVYYIGDTKEKGLEFIGYVAKFARVIAAQQEEDPDIDTVRHLARAAKDVLQSRKASLDERREIERTARERLLREQEENLKETARAQGLSEDQVQFWRERVLGIK